MKTLITTILILMGLSGTSPAADWSWSKEDIAREVLSAGLTVLDWGQTKDIVGRGRIELNPILGHHPTNRAVNNYFTGVIVLHPLISAALPAYAEVFGLEIRPRLAWQYFYFGFEGAAVVSNWKGGIHVRF